MLRITIAVVLGMATTSDGQDKVTAKTQALIDAIEKILPEHETAAEALDRELQALAASTDANVRLAVDSARLNVMAIRSVRKIIRQQPEYLLYHVSPASLPRWRLGAEHFLECARSAKDPFAGMSSGVRPVRSRIDGQLLLYKFRLPKGYDPSKRYPLRVELHAGGGFTWLAYWVTGKPDDSPRSAATDGAIHISPAGRQHVGMGEVAVLDAIADAVMHYAVDEDRIVIGGASWGGTGGFHFATFLPDRFAAAYSLTGGGNYNLPVGDGRYDAYLLADNLCTLPFLLWDTPGDGHYQANHAFADELRRRAATASGSYPHLELTDPKGGHGIIDRKLQEEGWAWLDRQSRNRYPRRVVYRTHWLRYDGAYWARVGTMENVDRPARIEAHVDGDSCHVRIDNADRFRLDLATALNGPTKMMNVHVNGAAPFSVSTGQTVSFRKTGGQWSVAPERSPPGLVKKHGVSGPIQDVFMEHPVLMVHGTTTSREPGDVTKMLDAIVDRLISTGDGSGVLRTGFERKADTAVSDRDLATKNLVLVGTPQQNRLLARIADQLPVTFLDDGVRLAGKDYRGAVGLAMVYPNPLNPERYVLLLPEVYGGGRPLDYPDWVLFQTPKDAKGPGRIVAKGDFDGSWQPLGSR